MKLLKINSNIYHRNPDRYELLDGKVEGAPYCPYGNRYQWIGYDKETKQFIRFTKSVFKLLVNDM